MGISAKPFGFDRAIRYFGEMEPRAAALGNKLSYEAALTLKNAVYEGQPGTPDGDRIRQAVSVAQVSGGHLGKPGFLPKAYATYLNTARLPKARLRELGPETVLYVRPRRNRSSHEPSEIAVLARHSPWTPDMLPVFPAKRAAVVVYRNVSREEAAKVRKARENDAPVWRKGLLNAGVRVGPPKMAPRARVTPDLVFAAARQEFGGGGQPAKKLWRSSIRHLAASGVKGIMRRSEMKKMISNSSYRGWREFKGLLAPDRIPVDTAKSFKRFQKRMTG